MNWYLTTILKDIETEEELAEKKIIVDKVLDRLITHVSQNFSSLLNSYLALPRPKQARFRNKSTLNYPRDSQSAVVVYTTPKVLHNSFHLNGSTLEYIVTLD